MSETARTAGRRRVHGVACVCVCVCVRVCAWNIVCTDKILRFAVIIIVIGIIRKAAQDIMLMICKPV